MKNLTLHLTMILFLVFAGTGCAEKFDESSMSQDLNQNIEDDDSSDTDSNDDDSRDTDSDDDSCEDVVTPNCTTPLSEWFCIDRVIYDSRFRSTNVAMEFNRTDVGGVLIYGISVQGRVEKRVPFIMSNGFVRMFSQRRKVTDQTGHLRLMGITSQMTHLDFVPASLWLDYVLGRGSNTAERHRIFRRRRVPRRRPIIIPR